MRTLQPQSHTPTYVCTNLSLNQGHLSTQDSQLGPSGALYREAPLYDIICNIPINTPGILYCTRHSSFTGCTNVRMLQRQYFLRLDTLSLLSTRLLATLVTCQYNSYSPFHGVNGIQTTQQLGPLHLLPDLNPIETPWSILYRYVIYIVKTSQNQSKPAKTSQNQAKVV